MRGDRPIDLELCATARKATPHARGSTLTGQVVADVGKGYPACAGIDLLCDCRYSIAAGLPRMRGDRPCVAVPI